MPDETFNNLLTHTCTISSRSTDDSTVDEWGAPEETITTSASGVACLFQEREEAVEFSLRGEKVISKYMAFFKITENISVDDLIEFNGRKYSVVGVDDAAGQGHHLEVSLKSLEN